MEALSDVPMPQYLYLDDGRLLTGYHRATTGDVMAFRLNVDGDIGQRPIDDERGVAILDEYRRRHDGCLLGPVVEPPVGALGRRARGRRSR